MACRLIIFILLISAAVFSAVEFEDTFDSSTSSWNSYLSGNYEISGGVMSITSEGSLGGAVVPGLALSDFSVSVSVKIETAGQNAMAGITFRTQNNNESYFFLITPLNTFRVYKLTGGAVELVNDNSQGTNSFIYSDDVNELTVSVSSDTSRFYCNGHFLMSIADASITSGGTAGLLVNGDVSASFDYFTVVDTVYRGDSPDFFVDEFYDGEIRGWKNYTGSGTFTESSGKLRGEATGSSNFTVLATDGDYGTADTAEVTLKRISGAANDLSGIMYHFAYRNIGGTNTAQGYLFAIADAYFAGYSINGSTVTPLFSPESSILIRADGDNTLKVVSDGADSSELFINDSLVKKVSCAEFPSGGAGLMLQGDLTVDFDNFKIAEENHGEITFIEDQNSAPEISASGAITVYPNPFNPSTVITVSAPQDRVNLSMLIYDSRGRIVARPKNAEKAKGRSSAQKFIFDASGMPAGVYIAAVSVEGRTYTEKIVFQK